jgi:hypothetical protein
LGEGVPVQREPPTPGLQENPMLDLTPDRASLDPIEIASRDEIRAAA